MTATKPLWSLTAAELMSREVIPVPRNMSLRAAGQLLNRVQISGAPVVDDQGRCIGVLSVSDLVHRSSPRDGRSPAIHPHRCCVCSDWQVIELESLPTDEVEAHMTRDPVTVHPSTGLGKMARMMVDAHIHRLIVVDAQDRPVGVVSSTDILAAVARGDQGLEIG